jgi:hypothetical protein
MLTSAGSELSRGSTSFSTEEPCFHCCPRGARIAAMFFLPGFVEAYLWTYSKAWGRAGRSRALRD